MNASSTSPTTIDGLHPKPRSKPGEKLFSDQGVPQGQETGDNMEAIRDGSIRPGEITVTVVSLTAAIIGTTRNVKVMTHD